MKITGVGQKSPLVDIELVENYRSTEDLEVLGILYHRYMHLVFGVCLKYFKNREEAKDAVMSIFEKLVVDLKEHEVSNFKSWLHVNTRNFCLMKLRSSKFKINSSALDINSDSGVEYGLPMHHDNEDIEDDLVILERCIEGLENAQQRSVRLFFLEQKCYLEICELTGFELKKVKSYIQNGKRNLKLCIENNRGKQD
ncbi:MAG: sigma-70 family RNA polymerase sigma factor [Bacteroidetes bacterium]|nr:sigma-70 family RNA polymerase sigma factor [Bacteroidota bacterium]MDA1119855.1 sigma-70 family RNA polymerase sigma factor [Bacteroidota bacterium]